MARVLFALLVALWLLGCALASRQQRGSGRRRDGEGSPHSKHAHRTVHGFETIDKDKHFSVLSMSLSHHSDGSWVVPSLHNRGSAGWNRTMIKGNLMRPYACTIQLYGLGWSLPGRIHEGWTGYMQMEVKQTKDVKMEVVLVWLRWE